MRKASYVAKHSPLFCTRECHTLARRNPPIEISDDGLTARIGLLARDGSVKAYALIDATDAEWAGQYTWGVTGNYAVRRVYHGRHTPDERIFLHRELLGLEAGDRREGDHINRDKLDNRRGNLRIVPDKAAQRQNIPSHRDAASPHRGVSFIKATGKWNARLTVAGQYHHVGHFRTEQEAAAAVKVARARLMPYAVD